MTIWPVGVCGVAACPESPAASVVASSSVFAPLLREDEAPFFVPDLRSVEGGAATHCIVRAVAKQRTKKRCQLIVESLLSIAGPGLQFNVKSARPASQQRLLAGSAPPMLRLPRRKPGDHV